MNTEKQKSGTVYIYNVFQCNFYLSKDCKVLETGVHPTTKKTWYKFGYEDTYDAYCEWVSKGKNKYVI